MGYREELFEEHGGMTHAATGWIALDGGDAEVWSWERTISGTCHCGQSCGTISVSVNGREVPTAREGPRFQASVRLREGENQVAVRCREEGGRECGSDAITLVGRLRAGPRARIAVSLGEQGILLDGSGSEPGEPEGAAVVGYSWHPREGNPEPLRVEPAGGGAGDEWVVVRPPERDGEYYVSLRVRDAKGRPDTATACFAVSRGQARLPDLARENPAWVEEAVVYGVVPPNFGPEGFRSVTARLDDLRELGITAIWLAPCTATPGKGHGYGVADYFRLRADYGTEADFRALIEGAHARGIRVLMDFVPNHSSAQHPYMMDVQARGRESPYYDFYAWEENGADYSYYFHWKRLPNLNYDNPEVRRWMMEAFSYWVREFDVDGFRVDAAWGVRLRRPDFWPEWRRELKRIKPDLLLLAEAGAREGYWFTNGFDAAYDWTEDLGQWALAHVFEEPDEIAGRLHAALTNEGRGFHEDALIFRFLNNNDTGPRFISRHGPGLERVAAAMLLTLPGLPCIYTGQEVGAEFEPYRTLGPISWEDRHGLRPYYARVIGLRRSMPALHSREWEIFEARSEGQTYAYARFDPEGGKPALVVLNFSPVEAQVEVGLSERARAFAEADRLVDVLGGEEASAAPTGGSAVRVRLVGWSARILMPGGLSGRALRT